MFLKILFQVISIIPFAIIISPDSPPWAQWIAWGVIAIYVLVGVVAINAEKMIAWADKKLKEDKNKRRKK